MMIVNMTPKQKVVQSKRKRKYTLNELELSAASEILKIEREKLMLKKKEIERNREPKTDV